MFLSYNISMEVASLPAPHVGLFVDPQIRVTRAELRDGVPLVKLEIWRRY